MNIAPITRFANRSALKVKKNSPQILFYAGIVGTVATTVLASRATLKAVPVVEEQKAQREFLDGQMADVKLAITQEEYTKEVTRQYTVTFMQLGKLYGPTVIVGGLSLAALTKSHQQLTSRNTALTMAYTGLFKTLESYRGRVRDELGVDADQRFLHGTVTEEVEVVGKNGKSTTKSITTVDPNSKAAYSIMFDSGCAAWCDHPGYNLNYLNGQQDWANHVLAAKGFLFLNEVYDLLHLPQTKEGAQVGWVWEDLGDNDTFVRFGHTDDGNFVGGFTRNVMLNFNIHGAILDLI